MNKKSLFSVTLVLFSLLIFSCKPTIIQSTETETKVPEVIPEKEIHLISDCTKMLCFIQNKTASGYTLESVQNINLPSGTTVKDITYKIPGFTIDFISQIDNKAYVFYSRNTISITFKNENESYTVSGLYDTVVQDYHYENQEIYFPQEDITYTENWHKICCWNLNFSTNYGTNPEPLKIDCCQDFSKIALPLQDQVLSNDQKKTLTIGTLHWIDENDNDFYIPENITADKTIQLRASWSTKTSSVENSSVFIENRNLVLPYGVWICEHEVTQKEYFQIMNTNPSFFNSNPADGELQENRPVERINFFHAVLYCNMRSVEENLEPCYSINGTTDFSQWGELPLKNTDETFSSWCTVQCNFEADGYRLLTEAEWEYAARGSQPAAYNFSGSSDANAVAWYSSNSIINGQYATHEVCKKQPNTSGLYDMTGNVLEWCWDWYDDITAETPYSGNSTNQEKSGIPSRISHGGSCGANTSYIKLQTRNQSPITDISQYVGMRICRTIAITPGNE